MITKGRLWPPFSFVRDYGPFSGRNGPRMKILGILNITSDSFSDGGKYLEPGAAIFHAQAMAQSGADIIDIGAASSNPDAEPVAPKI
jgi:dihydropteroate synthase